MLRTVDSRHVCSAIVLGMFVLWKAATPPVAANAETAPSAGETPSAVAATATPSEATPSAPSGDPLADLHKQGPQTLEDFEKINGPIFTNWPKPQAALLFSGELDGYLEPCGCAGLENQLGGLKRRHTLLKGLKAQGWNIASFDMGGLTKRLGHQAEIKFRFALQSLVQLGYSAVGLGAHELRLTTDELVYAIANLESGENPIVSANVALYSVDSGLTKPYEITEVGKRRIGVTSVVGAKHEKTLARVQSVVYRSPAAGLAEVAAKLADEHCTDQVLMVHGTPAEARELGKQFPQFNIIAATGGATVPPKTVETFKTGQSETMLVEVGHKGQYVVVLAFYDDPLHPIRTQRVPLDGRFEDSPEMQKTLVEYQTELKLLSLAGLGLTGSAHPEGKFIGSQACGDCHSTATEVFEASPHFHATDSIVELDPARHFDPECLSCHATGWNPQEYFPYSSGFMGLAKTPHLKTNGCENCHGPAAAHVAAEMGESDVTEAQQEALREALRLRIVEDEGNKDEQVYGTVVKNCMRCHDIDNSPDFDFQKYWPHVKHVGKE